MKNVTITLDEQVARWVRIRAAQLGKSVSRLVGDLLRERMVEEDDYQAAMKQTLSQLPRPLKQAGARYPSREELHDGPGLG